MMGHVVDPNEYNKAMRDQEYTLQEYLQAEPWLNIMSQDPTRVPAVEIDKIKLETQRTMEAVMNVVKSQQEKIDQLNSLLEAFINQG